jgi:hypothetical protein
MGNDQSLIAVFEREKILQGKTRKEDRENGEQKGGKGRISQNALEIPTASAMMTGIPLKICAWVVGDALTNAQLSVLSKIMPMDVEERAVTLNKGMLVSEPILHDR